MIENTKQFESRKKDHLRLALDQKTQALGLGGLDRIELVHEALPELNFEEINTKSQIFGHTLSVPFFISSMTAGHQDGVNLNLVMAKVAADRRWAMGVGSQRRELFDPEAASEWRGIRKAAPDGILMGNLGLTQLIQTSISQVQRLVDSLEAVALFVHTNPLQEALQPEGTPQFKGGLSKLKELTKALSVPVVLKEVGCGFSARTLEMLSDTGISALDLAGLGGTHWGRIEGQRSDGNSIQSKAAQTFQNWGISTLDSMMAARHLTLPYEIWGSGGVRDGLMAAKLLSLGALKVGFAQPILKAADQGEKALVEAMELFEYELRVAMFCTGSKDLAELSREGNFRWI